MLQNIGNQLGMNPKVGGSSPPWVETFSAPKTSTLSQEHPFLRRQRMLSPTHSRHFGIVSTPQKMYMICIWMVKWSQCFSSWRVQHQMDSQHPKAFETFKAFAILLHIPKYQWYKIQNYFPRYFPFVRGIHMSLEGSTRKGRVTRMFDAFFDTRPSKQLKKLQFSIWNAMTVMWRH